MNLLWTASVADEAASPARFIAIALISPESSMAARSTESDADRRNVRLASVTGAQFAAGLNFYSSEKPAIISQNIRRRRRQLE